MVSPPVSVPPVSVPPVSVPPVSVPPVSVPPVSVSGSSGVLSLRPLPFVVVVVPSVLPLSVLPPPFPAGRA
ncbi:MAG: hypothetical protein CML02_02885 [Pseudooceanicola sp.]|nr:hypothetical protein [Pseudooceanicola sp.]